MNARQSLWLLLAALSLCAALLALLLPLEVSRQRVELGPAPEVRGNPWLAAEHFLRRQQVAVERADSLRPALAAGAPQGRSLLLLGPRQQLDAAQQRRLLDWVAAGGHLILIAEGPPGAADPLLDRLGIGLRSAAAAADSADPWPELAKLALPGEPAPAYLAFAPHRRLTSRAPGILLQARSAYGSHLLQRRWGAGRVSVLADGAIWHNQRIAEHDHAWLLWYLTRGSQVTLLQRLGGESLPHLLLRHFPEALAALGLLLALLLWHLGLRQGPPLGDLPPPRRALGERLLASARFICRQQGHAALLVQLQQAVHELARQRHPGFEQLPAAARWAWLGQRAGLPTSTVARLMQAPDSSPGAAAFTAQVAHLQRLRNALS